MNVVCQGWLPGLPRYEAAPRNCDRREAERYGPSPLRLDFVSERPAGAEARERREARIREVLAAKAAERAKNELHRLRT